jgi:hypothetical protein
MLGFKAFEAAQSTLVGIELMHMLRKGSWQMALDRVSRRPNSFTLSPHNPLTDGSSSPHIGYTPKIATEPAEVLNALAGLLQDHRSSESFFVPIIVAHHELDCHLHGNHPAV